MNPREFKSAIDPCLRPTCDRLGFTREKSTTSRWMLKKGKEYLLYEIAKGVKNPFIPGLGGRFHVWVYVLPTPDYNRSSYENAISYLKHFSDRDLELLGQLRDHVLRKLVAQESSDSFTALVIETGKLTWESDIGRKVLRQHPVSLPYLDREDVLAWGISLRLAWNKLSTVSSAPRTAASSEVPAKVGSWGLGFRR